MKIEERIKQSEIRVKSGIKLILFLLVVTVSFYLWGPFWLSKLFGAVTLFFLAVTLLEYWNAWRLKRRMSNEPAE